MYFTASHGAKDTSRNVRAFVKGHQSELWSLVKSVAPVLLVLSILSMFVDYSLTNDAVAYMGQHEVPKTGEEMITLMRDLSMMVYQNPIGWIGILLQILTGYCFAVIAVSWHRLVLLGPERAQPMKIFSPQKHEIHFVVAWMMISFIIPHAMAMLTNLNIGYVLLSTLVFPYVFFKLSFYFPAKALDSHLSFRHSFMLTEGLFFKFVLSLILSFWRISLMVFVLAFVSSIVAGIVTKMIFGPNPEMSHYLMGVYHQMVHQMILKLPVTFYFQPIMTVLGVTILSNYYQYALQNKDAAKDVSV